MSEYFLAKYRSIADALLKAHELTVPDMTRDMLATNIAHNRELPAPESKSPGTRSALPALRKARTHARKLIEYANHPAARKASVPLRCEKLAAAIRTNELRVGLELALADVDTGALLDTLDAGRFDADTLHRLERVVDAVENESGGIGRPLAAHTRIIRAGCIAWERGGNVIGYQWDDDEEELRGALPDFLRDLITCCDGTHELVTEKPRRVPVGYRVPRPEPKGNTLRKRAPDMALRDGIRAWKAWRAKSRTFLS